MKSITSLLVFSALLAGCGGGANEQWREPHLAAMACRDGVKGRLPSPDSARFPDNDGASRVDDATIKVDSYVDAKNSFGATSRTRFTCTVRVDSGKFTVESLDVQS